MSKRILITFGGRAYDAQVAKQCTALRCSPYEYSEIITHFVYDDAWLITTPFYALNRWIFERQPQHGFGFCSWKPFIIQHALHNFASQGDVVMYLDGDTYPIADISCLFEYAERQGVMLFEEQGCVNKTWIKEECFRTMGVAPGWMLPRDAMHACGRFQLFRKGDYRNDQFLAEWQTYSLNPRCTFHGGSISGDPDDPSFIRNSCEQSVLSLLAYMYNIPLHRTPDQNGWPVSDGYKPEDAYPRLFVQDGARGNVGDLSGSRYRNV